MADVSVSLIHSPCWLHVVGHQHDVSVNRFPTGLTKYEKPY